MSKGLLLASVTLDPPVEAALFRVTLQALAALGVRLLGLQVSAETRTGASRLIVEVCELLPRVAVTIAF